MINSPIAWEVQQNMDWFEVILDLEDLGIVNVNIFSNHSTLPRTGSFDFVFPGFIKSISIFQNGAPSQPPPMYLKSQMFNGPSSGSSNSEVEKEYSPENSNDSQGKYSLLVSPNPSRGSAKIVFELPLAQKISLELINASGQAFTILTEQEFKAGMHEYPLNLTKGLSGVYWLRMVLANQVIAVKVIII